MKRAIKEIAMSVRLSAAAAGIVLFVSTQPALAQAPTCTTNGATMVCTFPAPGGDPFWVLNGNNIGSTNSGNVGIGTSNPTGKLDVNGAVVISNNNQLYFRNAAGSPDANIREGAGGNLDIVGPSQGSIVFSNHTDSGTSMVITDAGNVGISGNLGVGTTNPGRRLDIRGQDPALRLWNNGTGAQSWVVANGLASPNDGKFALYDETANAPRLVIDTSGNVGIGTSTPAAKLHVAGNVTVDGNIGARYQDVAEWVRTTERLSAGTVVVIGAGETNVVEASSRPYDIAVVGVVSPQPGIVLGEAAPDKVLVAQSGRVRVKVDASYGAIRQGDLLVTSPTPGVAMRSEPLDVGGASFHRPGTLLGKALEALPSGQGEILVLLTLQ